MSALGELSVGGKVARAVGWGVGASGTEAAGMRGAGAAGKGGGGLLVATGAGGGGVGANVGVSRVMA